MNAYGLSHFTEDSLPEIGKYYQEALNGNFSNTAELARLTHIGQEEIAKVIIGLTGFHPNFYRKLLLSEIAKIREAGYKGDIDTDSLLKLEAGTKGLLFSIAFDDFAQGKSIEELKELPAYMWHDVMRRAFLEEDYHDIDIMGLMEIWFSECDNIQVKDVERLWTDQHDLEDKNETYRYITLLNADEMKEFIKSYHTNNELPINHPENVKNMIDFILYVYIIGKHIPREKVSQDDTIALLNYRMKHGYLRSGKV